MSIIIDLIIVGIILLCVGLGYKKGLAKCAIKILSFVIALVVVAILYKPVSNLVIQNTEIDENIQNSVINLIGKDVSEEGKVKEDSNLPKTMVEHINKEVENAVGEARDNIVKNVAQEISVVTINIAVAIALFILVRIALIFVSALSKIITDLPVIKQVDKLGGIAYGVLKAGIIIFAIFAFISFISPMIEQTGIVVAINKSFIGGMLYNNNLLLKIIF